LSNWILDAQVRSISPLSYDTGAFAVYGKHILVLVVCACISSG